MKRRPSPLLGAIMAASAVLLPILPRVTKRAMALESDTQTWVEAKSKSDLEAIEKARLKRERKKGKK